MDKEVSEAVHIAVSLIALSVLISIVMYTVYIGNDYKRDIIDKAVGVEQDIGSGQLNSLVLNDDNSNVMPKVSAYYILSKEFKAVKELSFKDAGSIAPYATFFVNTDGHWTLDGQPDSIVDAYTDAEKASDYTKRKYLLPSDILDATKLEGKVRVIVTQHPEEGYTVTLENITD